MASSAFATLTMPTVNKDGLNYLGDTKIAKSFQDSLQALVETVKPEDLGVDLPYLPQDQPNFPGVYADGLISYLTKKPYALKELVGKSKVTFADLSTTDKTWVRNKIVEIYKKLRSSSDFKSFSTRIVSETTYNWMAFRTVDCVFAAIIHELSGGLTSARVKTPTKGNVTAQVTEAEKGEAAMETWLASQLGVPRTVMEDSRLVYILEEDLEFPNIAAIGKYSDLTTNTTYKNKSYIVSYEVRDGFWHTVHVSLKGNNPVVTDRQASATTTNPTITTTAKCDVWEINRDGEKFRTLLQAFETEFKSK